MPSEGKETAELLLFFNTLFASINGNIDLRNDKYKQLWNEWTVIMLLQFFEQ